MDHKVPRYLLNEYQQKNRKKVFTIFVLKGGLLYLIPAANSDSRFGFGVNNPRFYVSVYTYKLSDRTADNYELDCSGKMEKWGRKSGCQCHDGGRTILERHARALLLSFGPPVPTSLLLFLAYPFNPFANASHCLASSLISHASTKTIILCHKHSMPTNMAHVITLELLAQPHKHTLNGENSVASTHTHTHAGKPTHTHTAAARLRNFIICPLAGRSNRTTLCENVFIGL